MTFAHKVDALRVLIGETEKTRKKEDTGVLTAYLHLAGDKVLERMYPFKRSYEGLEVPDKYVSIQLKIAAYMLNKRGAEGEVQHIENGVHRNYGDADVPEGMLSGIPPFVGFPD